MTRIAACGGVYANPHALTAFIEDARRRGAQRLLCLGDLGGFGAEPEAVWPLLRRAGVECIAGNYELAIGQGRSDCGCGYRDPTDNAFAQVLYDYTLEHTGSDFAAWMAALPTERRERLGSLELHLVHGSPLAVNDFWWESLAGEEHLRRVDASGADLILCTHSGLPWQRHVGAALVVNVGVIGRPANDGRAEVWYALIDVDDGGAEARLVALAYDWRAQAASMRAAGLPEPFAETIETGWWTTCLEVLPPAERARGRYHLYRSALPELRRRLGVEDDGDGAEEEDGGTRPVVTLFGSPLFPARLWVDVRHAAGSGGGGAPAAAALCALVDEAAAEGFDELVLWHPGGSPGSGTEALAAACRRRGARVVVAAGPDPLGLTARDRRPSPATTAPQLTVCGDRFSWCPVDPPAGAAADLRVARDAGSGPNRLGAAKRAVTRRFLELRQADGSISSRPTCAA